MNTSKENLISLPDKPRSPFSVSVPEIVFAILVALVTWFGLRSFLQSARPYPCGSSVNNIPIDCGWTEEQAWQTLGMPLFSKSVIPFVVCNTLAAVFLIRAIRRDAQGFSRLGRVALAWPLLSLPVIPVLFYSSACVSPIGFILGILATVTSARQRLNKLDWISLLITFMSMVACQMFFGELLTIYGD